MKREGSFAIDGFIIQTFVICLCTATESCIRGGVLYQSVGRKVQHAEKYLTQSDLRFCENQGSNRFKINEKGGIPDRKAKQKIYTKCLKSVK